MKTMSHTMPLLLGVCVLCAVIVGSLTNVAVPGASKLAAPMLCPEGTRESVVVRSVTNSGRGGANITSALYCIDSEGGGTRVSGFKIACILSGMAAVGLGGLFVAWMLLRRLGATPPGGRA